MKARTSKPPALADMPGAKSLGINLDAVTPVPSKTYPPRSTVVSFEIEGRAVPWSVSRYRGGKEPRLAAWQKRVGDEARLAMGGRLPHDGPFAITAWFSFASTGQRGDLTNLLKAAEDAIQGIVFVNDRDAFQQQTYLLPGEDDRIAVVVTAMEREVVG